MAATWDGIVLGLGGFGSGALCHLARRGGRVLGIEQYGIAHDHGSSHGESRIIRTAYFEHPDYVPLLQRAFAGWRELEQASGASLLHETGLFLCGPPGGETVAGSLRAAAEHGLAIESLTAEDAARRFPTFRFPHGTEVVFEQQAGWLAVERCVAAHLAEARRAGAELRLHERIERWRSDGRQATVWTDRGVYHAASLVIAAGPWATRLLADVGVPLQVLRKVPLWFGASPGAYDSTPCFLYERPEGAFYGFPSLDGVTVKVAEHTGGDPVEDPALVDRLCHPADIERVAAFVRDALPSATPLPLKHAVCLYTQSPDGHFLVDRHPQFPNVVYGAGFSGHGFKFTGVLGEALADLALEGRTALPVDFLRWPRPTTAD